ncbi:MAG: response regulator [Desulfobacterales bacterium]|nr:response regulator [Desulfobacterales bacterium]
MPEMDGYEATQSIRKNLKFNSLPIIAMTANALQGEREKCLIAGMNDYLTKPIEIDKLYSTLAKWVNPVKKETDMIILQDISSGNDFSEEIPENLPGIEVKDALKRLAGNKLLFKKLLLEFLRDYADIKNEIEQMINDDNNESALKLIHKIKGIAGNLSAKTLQKAAESLELIIKNSKLKLKDSFNFNNLLDQFGIALKSVLESGKYFENEKK